MLCVYYEYSSAQLTENANWIHNTALVLEGREANKLNQHCREASPSSIWLIILTLIKKRNPLYCLSSTCAWLIRNFDCIVPYVLMKVRKQTQLHFIYKPTPILFSSFDKLEKKEESPWLEFFSCSVNLSDRMSCPYLKSVYLIEVFARTGWTVPWTSSAVTRPILPKIHTWLFDCLLTAFESATTLYTAF